LLLKQHENKYKLPNAHNICSCACLLLYT